MPIKMVKGDLIKAALDGKFNIIGHGCNCFCCFGAGIAAQIKRQFPDAYKIDCQTISGDRKKLGSITVAFQRDVFVVNAYTQYRYGRGGPHCDYDAIRMCMKAVKKSFSGKRIGLPMIGCGLAGGSWPIVQKIIE